MALVTRSTTSNVDCAMPRQSFDRITVRVRLDDNKPATQSWTESTDRKALFSSNAVALAKKIASSKRMIFEFTPFNSNTVTVIFNVEGLSVLLPEIAETCKLKK